VAVATIVAVCVAGFQWCELQKANQTASEAISASKRAWLSIEGVTLRGPTKISEEGMGLSLVIVVKNVGESPATNVSVEVDTYFVKDGMFLDAQKAFTQALTNKTKLLPSGTALFRDDTLELRIGWPVPSDKFKGKIRETSDGRRLIDFQVFVGVGYKIIGDPEPHITLRNFNMLNTPIGTELKPGETKRMRLPSAPSPTNCDPNEPRYIAKGTHSSHATS
jgi:hypothetical protein